MKYRIYRDKFGVYKAKELCGGISIVLDACHTKDKILLPRLGGWRMRFIEAPPRESQVNNSLSNSPF